MRKRTFGFIVLSFVGLFAIYLLNSTGSAGGHPPANSSGPKETPEETAERVAAVMALDKVIIGVQEEEQEEDQEAVEGEPTPSPDHPGLFVTKSGELVDDLGIIIRLSENEDLCVKCHYGKSTTEKLVMDWDKSRHAQRGVTCAKCHGGDYKAKDLATAKKAGAGAKDFRTLKGGLKKLTDSAEIDKAAFDYCGNCHGEKIRDWEAGIHGKRLGSWNGEKTYWICTKCHNPHSPRFKPIKPLPPPVKPDKLRSVAKQQTVQPKPSGEEKN